MKVLVCGRGGSGKSTVTAMLARSLASSGEGVLVIDGDESNSCLFRMLGVKRPERSVMEDLGGKRRLKEGLLSLLKEDRLDEASALLAEYAHPERASDAVVSRSGNLMLMEIGKIEHPDEGCACPMGVLDKELLLRIDATDLWVFVDAEAGIEHIGRGVYEGSDLFLLVLEPSFESLELSRRMRCVSKETGKPLLAVANRLSSGLDASFTEALEKEGIPLVGVLPSKDEVALSNLRGEAVPILPEAAEILSGLKRLVRQLGCPAS